MAPGAWGGAGGAEPSCALPRGSFPHSCNCPGLCELALWLVGSKPCEPITFPNRLCYKYSELDH
jgi:hypothetical protein